MLSALQSHSSVTKSRNNIIRQCETEFGKKGTVFQFISINTARLANGANYT